MQKGGLDVDVDELVTAGKSIKYIADKFETLVGALHKTQDWPAVQAYIEEVMGPVIEAAEEAHWIL